MKMSKCNKIHDMTEELLSNGVLHINATLLTISCHLGGSSERLGGWLFLNIGIASFSKNIYRQNFTPCLLTESNYWHEGGIHNHGEYTAQESCAFW
jgi:hypothetical protein